jgi:large subunit ribosomal protein L17
MHNRIGYNRLGRKSSHRKALIRNMVSSLFKFERITTTKAKALEVRKKAEKMITRAKVDSVHNRREAAKFLYEQDIIGKLFSEIGPRNASRNGGLYPYFKDGNPE